jgi:single-stranded-DNA-specific exonuclease
MVDRTAAAERIARAIRERERVCVFGDYDCDGITSTAILTQVIQTLGGVVTPLVASRFDGGYGVSPAAARRIRATEAKLLVTCDCGSSDHATLGPLRDEGMDIVVIDHHLVPDTPLPVNAFLNPHRPECGFAYKGLASCGLALSIAAAVRTELGVDLDVRRWLDLVAIGTIADVAPLVGETRLLVGAGLERLSHAERPGLRALFELAKVARGMPISGRDVAFRIAPRINAPGRLGAADAALRLLLADNDAEARAFASEVENQSATRRQIQAEILREAKELIESDGQGSGGALVLGALAWNPGVVGIVAGRLADEYNLPTIVIGFDGDVGRGSVRGPDGFPLHDALSQVQDCLVRFGGHQAAAGLEIERARLPELSQRFTEVCAEISRARGKRQATLRDWIRLDPRETPKQILTDLERLEPCGEKNPRPSLVVSGTVVSARSVNGGHLKLELDLGQHSALGGFAFEKGPMASEIVGRSATVVGDLRWDTFRGGGAVELFVEEILS